LDGIKLASIRKVGSRTIFQPVSNFKEWPTYLTQRDVDNFGPEMIDLAQRAGLHAVGPELQRLHEENQLLRDEVTRAAKMAIDRELDAAVPNWRQINNDPRFHQWLLSQIYSGVIRDHLLKDAAAAANAARVISSSRGFSRKKEPRSKLLLNNDRLR
jgi:hypothetical protein